MFRLAGLSRPIREAVPPELVPVFWAITLLGSAKFLMVALSLSYWNVERRRDELLALVSVAFLALSVTLVLKHGFAMPRPPEGVQRYPVEPSPVGFPSGHAIAATVVYGGALVAFDRVRDPAALAGAGTLAFLVGISRVVLGVHYLGDVLAGFLVGLVVLAGLVVLVEEGAVYGFGVAAVLAVPALVVTGGGSDAALALGGSLGGFVGALLRTAAVSFRTTAERAAINAGGVAVLVGTVALNAAADGLFAAAAVLNFLLAFLIVGLPMAVGKLDALGPASRMDW